jgi:hypothetical protein
MEQAVTLETFTVVQGAGMDKKSARGERSRNIGGRKD